MATRKQMLTDLYKENGLETEDVFKHKHYVIIKRSGIDKIQAKQQINIDYEVIKCDKDFSVVKAVAEHDGRSIQTFGSALHGKGGSGNTTTHYVMEMAEKRAMSRAVLKLAGFYELGAYSEDESEDFKASKPTPTQQYNAKIVALKKNLDKALAEGDIEWATSIYDEAEANDNTQVCNYFDQIFKTNEKETAA